MMRFRQYTIDAVVLRMKVIKACLVLYDHEDDHTNSNTNSQPGDVDNGVIPVAAQASERGFKIISEHKWIVLVSNPPTEYQLTIV